MNSEPAVQDAAASWEPGPPSWQGATGQGGAPGGRGVAAPQKPASGGKRIRGLLATGIVAVVVIGIVAGVALVLTTGGAAVVEEEAAVAAAPQKAFDQAAQSLLRNAMTAMDAAFVESADYTTVTQSILQAMEPAIAWMPGRAGASASPPAAAVAQGNAVSWACTGRLSYELGTMSASGAAFGVKVNKGGGGVTYLKNGAATGW